MICKCCWWFRNPANHHLGCDRNLVNQWDKLPFPQLLSLPDFWLPSTVSGWWFQPIWKIWSSNWAHLPRIFGVKIKNLWNHQPGICFSPLKQQEDFQLWLFRPPASSVAAFHVDQAPWSSSTCVCHQCWQRLGGLVGPNGGWTLKWWVYPTTMDFPTRNDQHLGWRLGVPSFEETAKYDYTPEE